MTEEKVLSEKLIYSGKILKVHCDDIYFPDGKTAIREYIDHPGGVGIVPLTEENEIIMVKQYRYALRQEVLEIPAGKIDRSEGPEKCAHRELKEEIKMDAQKMTFLGEAFPSPGCMNEILYIYLGQGLFEKALPEDDDEYLAIEKIPFERAVKMVMNGEIKDAKSIIGILKAKEFLQL